MRIVLLLLCSALPSTIFGAPDAKLTLLDLAKKTFTSRALTDAEVKLFTATEAGEETSLKAQKIGKPEDNNPANAAGWPNNRVIHAECLNWLFTDRKASQLVTYKGITLRGIRVDGDIDLDDAEVKFPFFASNCSFQEISLRRAHLRGVYFRACYLTALNANAATVDNGFFLREGSKGEGSKTRGEVNFVNATIGNILDCNGAEFINADGKAFNGSGARIKGIVLLQHGFRARGELNFEGVTIDGDLACDSAELRNPRGKALNVSTGKIGGDVSLRRVTARGDVDFTEAEIRGSFKAEGASFKNLSPRGVALSANGATIRGNMYLTRAFKDQKEIDFRAQGEIDLFQTSVGGSLELYHAQLTTGRGATLDLQSATVGVLRDDESSWPLKGRLLLDGFTYSRISGDSSLNAMSRVRWLHLQPATNFRPQPYEQLASVLRTMGDEREARRVMITKNSDHATFIKPFSGGWWWYNVFGWLIGYGYTPSRAFWISLGMIALGWLVFHVGYLSNIISPTDEKGYLKDAAGQIVEENGRDGVSEHYTKFNAFVYSVESFTPLIKLDQTSSWMPNANRGLEIHFWYLHLRTGSLLRMYLWLHIVAGWILTSLWVGGVTGLVKT